MATKKEKRYAIQYILNLAGIVPCELLQHKAKYKHKSNDTCLEEYHRDRQLYLVRELLTDIINKQ